MKSMPGHLTVVFSYIFLWRLGGGHVFLSTCSTTDGLCCNCINFLPNRRMIRAFSIIIGFV